MSEEGGAAPRAAPDLEGADAAAGSAVEAAVPDHDPVVRLYTGFQVAFPLLFWLPVFYEVQKRVGMDDPQIFGIQSLYYVAFCLLEVPTGVAADTLGYRACMRFGGAVLLLANAAPILAPGYQGFLAHFLLIALARSFVSGASSAYLYTYCQEAGAPGRYKEVEGRARALGLVTKVAAWSAAGWAVERSLLLPYWLTLGSALAASWFAWRLPSVVPDEGEGPRLTSRERFAGSLGALRASPRLVLAVLQGVAVFVLARICQVNLFQPILDSKDAPVISYGLVMSMMTAFEAVGSARPGWVRRFAGDGGAVLGLSTALGGVLLVLPALGFAGTVAALAVFAFCAGTLFPIQRQVLNDAIPDPRYRATLLSIESIVDRAVNAVLAAMIGGFLDAGRMDLYLRGAAVGTLGLMVVLALLRRRWKVTDADDDARGPGASDAA